MFVKRSEVRRPAVAGAFYPREAQELTIVPLVVGAVSPKQVARVIETMLGKRTLLVVSTDLSHYLDYATAERHDLATAGTIERLDYTTLGPNDACGFSALNGALCAASRCGWTVTRLDLRNSGDTSGEKRRVVGYGAWAFTFVEDQPPVAKGTPVHRHLRLGLSH